MAVKHIAFTAYPSNDVARSRRWYEENLGLVFVGPYIEDGVEKYNEVHLDGGCFSLMSAEWMDRAAGSASSIYFEVDDLDETLAELESRLAARVFRLNRQYLACACAIASFESAGRGRIHVTLEPRPDDDVIVSQEVAAAFRAWVGR